MHISDKIKLAIKKINPDAEYSMFARNLDTITWHNNTPPIPKADIEAKMAELPTEEEERTARDNIAGIAARDAGDSKDSPTGTETKADAEAAKRFERWKAENGMADERFRELMRRELGYDEHFDVSCYSWELGTKKPEPAYFEIAVERIGAAPAQVLFVDDVAANVEAARAVGLRAVHWHLDEGHDVLLDALAGHGLALGEAGAA
mgnify:CR=1 FL=1